MAHWTPNPLCLGHGHHKFSGLLEIDATYVGGKEVDTYELKKQNAVRGPVGQAVTGIYWM